MVRKHRPGTQRNVGYLHAVTPRKAGDERTGPSGVSRGLAIADAESHRLGTVQMNEHEQDVPATANAGRQATLAPQTNPKRPLVERAARYIWRTVSSPPWIGLVLLCVGSMIFELTLFALLPITKEARDVFSMRMLLIPIAALPAIAAIVVAVAANWRSPLRPAPPQRFRLTSVDSQAAREERWREYRS